MKVKVIKRFIDKHTGKVHKPTKDGTFLNIDKKRYEEIIGVDKTLIEVVDDATPVDDVAENATPTEKKKTSKKATKKDTE